MSNEEIARCHCNSCGRSTDHRLIDRRVVEDSDEPDDDGFPPYWWTDTYETLQCLGCGSVCLKQHTKEATGVERHSTFRRRSLVGLLYGGGTLPTT